jgi:hypothetical protein
MDRKVHDLRYREQNREKLRLRQREYRRNLKLKALDQYGRACQVCQFDDIRALQIDHIGGGGNAHRIEVGGSIRFSGWKFYEWLSKEGWPDGYQTLCANHNVIKHLANAFEGC